MASCATWDLQSGVSNRWRDEALPQMEKGHTTQSEVIQLLGPPSQIIALNDQVVFYYLLQRDRGTGVILIVYNRISEEVTYDRAIFFFDTDGILEDFAYSHEAASDE